MQNLTNLQRIGFRKQFFSLPFDNFLEKIAAIGNILKQQRKNVLTKSLILELPLLNYLYGLVGSDGGGYFPSQETSSEGPELLDDGDMEFEGFGSELLSDGDMEGVDLVVNGDFANWTDDDPDDWTVDEEGDATSNITENPSGTVQLISDGTYAAMRPSISILEVGKTYEVSINVTDATLVGNGLFVGTTGDGSFLVTSTGLTTQTIIAETTLFVIKRGGSAMNMSFDNVTVTEVFGAEELSDGDMEFGLGSELLADGDMEFTGLGSEKITGTDADFSGPGNWTGVNLGTFDVDSTVAGKAYILGDGGSDYMIIDASLEGNKIYSVSLKARLNAGASAPLRFGTNIGSNVGSFEFTPTGTEQTFTGTFIANSETPAVGNQEGVIDGIAFEIDDVSVKEVTDTQDWTAQNNAILTKETGDPQEGTRSLRVAYDDSSNPNASQGVVTSGKRYRITGYGKGDGTNAPRVKNSGGTEVWVGVTTATWQAFDIEIVADGSLIRFGNNASSAGFTEFDDVSVKEVLMGDELFVVANAASDPNGNEADATTGWAKIGVLTTLTSDSSVKSVGGFSIKGVFDSSGGSIYFDLNTILTVGKRYRLTFDARHTGSGGLTNVRLEATTGGTINILLAELNNTDTTFQTITKEFVHSADTQYFLTRERSATDDGGTYIDNISVKEVLATQDWTAGNGATLTKEDGTRTGGSGTKVLRITRDDAENPRAAQSAMTSGKRYRVTGWARSDNSALPRVNYGGTTLITLTNSTAWQYFDEEFVTNSNEFRLLSVTNTGNQYTEWDDVSIVEVTDTQAWTAFGATLTKETTDPHGGSRLLRVLADAGAGVQVPQAVELDSVVIGKRYVYSVWARSDGTEIPEIVQGANTPVVGTDSTEWQLLEMEFVADTNTSIVMYFGITDPAGTEYVEFDDASVVEVTDAEAWTVSNDAVLTKEDGTRAGGSGSKVLKIARDETNQPGADQTLLTIGKRYRLTGWAKGDGSARPRIREALTATVLFFGTNSATWQEFDIEFVADNVALQFQSFTSTGNQFTEWDDVTVIELIGDAGDVALCTNPALDLGRDILLEGTFPNNPGVWLLGDGWTIAGNTASSDGSQGAQSFLNQASPFRQGVTAEITYTVSNRSAGSVTGHIQGTPGTSRTENGTFTDTLVAVSGINNGILASDDFIGDITNVSIKQKDILASTDFPGSEELNEDGDGTADKDNYTAGNSATLTNPSTNLLRVTRNVVNDPYAFQNILTIGKRYRVTGETRSDGNATPKVIDLQLQFAGTTSTDWQPFNFEFTAGQAALLFLSETSTGTQYTEWRNLSVTEANPLNGKMTGVLIDQPGNDKILKSWLLDGALDYVDIHSAEMNSIFNPDKGTLLAFAKVKDAGVWTDSTVRRIIGIQSGSDNLIVIDRDTPNNQLRVLYEADNIRETLNISTTTTDWFLIAVTWDTSADGGNGEIKVYLNGVQVGATQAIGGVWVGNLDSTKTIIGATITTPANVWDGNIAHILLLNHRKGSGNVLDADTILHIAQLAGVA